MSRHGSSAKDRGGIRSHMTAKQKHMVKKLTRQQTERTHKAGYQQQVARASMLAGNALNLRCYLPAGQ